MNRYCVCIFSLILFLLPSAVSGKVIESDTVWSGEVSVEKDIFIPEGVTLTVSSGTRIIITPSEFSKTDPEFFSPRTEIMVRGSLVVDGNKGSPVTFVTTTQERSSWAGIIVDGGTAVLRFTTIHHAEAAVDVIRGSVDMSNSLLTKNRYGLTVQGDNTPVSVTSSSINENDYGVVLLNGATIESRDNRIKGNRKKDSYSSAAKNYHPQLLEYQAEEKEKSRIYNDEVILGTVYWQGRIEVNGSIRVPGNARLIIMPGTVVEIRKKDTNNDGIGENGFFIQGNIIAKGTKENPIFFRSAEKEKGVYDWNAINILNSDRAQNIIEYVQIENAYRGMHFHFANVVVRGAVLKNNARGIQFQESIVDISGTHFYENKSALWARDSEIIFSGNLIYNNYSGINFYRNDLTFKDNYIRNNERGGLRVREGMSVVEQNLIDSNRYGLMVVDSIYGTFSRNVISHNLESGISLRGPVNIEINGNVVQGNGLNGIRIQNSSALIQGNLISRNGERGIGVVSFNGIIKENNILSNGQYNLGIDGVKDVTAPANWWGAEDAEDTIYDKEDDPSKGRAEYLPILEKPVILTWPLKTVPADVTWQGAINVKEIVTVERGMNLAIVPNTRVLFSEKAGLVVKGKITAKGEKNAPVMFSSVKGEGAGEWDEIRLEYADGSILADCTIENATWGLHIHFTDLRIERCSFAKNYGGLRFRSGPVEIRNSRFQENEIGLRTNMGIGLMTDSLITKNRIGIFIKRKGSGFKIRKNNLFANTDYNIRVGDFNDEDVDARDNWWGNGKPGDTIFDERYEPEIGRVHFIPYADKVLALDIPAQKY
jgi:parallel beta-helix repeat protein